MDENCSGRISPQDLAARIYPVGDVRNDPAVRKWMDQFVSARGGLPFSLPNVLECFEQRAERVYWTEWSDQLSKRLSRPRYDGAYVISSGTLRALMDAFNALQGDIQQWRPELGEDLAPSEAREEAYPKLFVSPLAAYVQDQ